MKNTMAVRDTKARTFSSRGQLELQRSKRPNDILARDPQAFSSPRLLSSRLVRKTFCNN